MPIERFVLTLGSPAPRSFQALGDSVYYYESSLCSLVDAGDTCAGVKRNFQLEPVASHVFPAIPSSDGERYARPEVPVALYQVITTRNVAAIGD